MPQTQESPRTGHCPDEDRLAPHAGSLLADLERRQDEVLEQLDALEQQLNGVLQQLGVTLGDEPPGDAAAAPATSQEVDADLPQGSAEPSAVGPGFCRMPELEPLAKISPTAGDAAHRPHRAA